MPLLPYPMLGTGDSSEKEQAPCPSKASRDNTGRRHRDNVAQRRLLTQSELQEGSGEAELQEGSGEAGRGSSDPAHSLGLSSPICK